MLFAIDFDDTITDGQTNNIIAAKIRAENAATGGKSPTKEDVNKQWDLVKDINPIGGAEKWKNTLSTMLNEGHQVAIVSFNAYGKDIIPRYLKEVVGLNDEEANKIKVVSWMPNNPPNEDIPAIDPSTANKNYHIELAKQVTHFQGMPEDIILIDDNEDNTNAAADKNYTTIVAKDDGSHLDKIADQLTATKQAQQNTHLEEKHTQIEFEFNSPHEEDIFIQYLEKSYHEENQAKNPSTENRDAENIIFNRDKTHPLASYDKDKHQLTMLKTNPSVKDYIQILKISIKALAKTIFGKIKIFFTPNKKEKDQMQQALENVGRDPELNSTIKERGPLPPILTEYRDYMLQQLRTERTREKEALSVHQAEIKSIDDHLKHGYKEKIESFFKENTPPGLYDRMLPVKEKYLKEMEKPLKLPNAIDEKFLEAHEKNLENTMENFKKDLKEQIQTENKNPSLHQSISLVDPQQAYQKEIKQLQDKTLRAVDNKYFQSAYSWSDAKPLQDKIVDYQKHEEALKSATQNYLFAKTPEETAKASAEIESIFVNKEGITSHYNNPEVHKNMIKSLTVKILDDERPEEIIKQESQEHAEKKLEKIIQNKLEQQNTDFKQYISDISTLKTDYNKKSHISEALYQAENKAQEKYSESSQQTYNEIYQNPNKHKALFSIENNFQEQIKNLHKQHAYEDISKAYQERDSQLKSLKSAINYQLHMDKKENKEKTDIMEKNESSLYQPQNHYG